MQNNLDKAMNAKDAWWKEYIEGRLVRKIMEHVFHWEIFGSWESYQRKYGAKEWEIGAGKTYTTPTPVAFHAYGHWQVFSADHNDLGEFDPLHNMKDAWQVAEQFEEVEISRHIPKKYRCKLWYHLKQYSATAETAEEAICKAALKAHGIE